MVGRAHFNKETNVVLVEPIKRTVMYKQVGVERAVKGQLAAVHTAE